VRRTTLFDLLLANHRYSHNDFDVNAFLWNEKLGSGKQMCPQWDSYRQRQLPLCCLQVRPHRGGFMTSWRSKVLSLFLALLAFSTVAGMASAAPAHWHWHHRHHHPRAVVIVGVR